MRRIALWSLLALGCATPSANTRAGEKPKRTGAAEYYPLNVGNSWTYRVRFGQAEQQQTITIQSEENGFFKDDANPPSELTADAYGLRDKLRYLLREPVEVGTHWTNVVSPSSIEDYRIVSLESCASPAGSFDKCVVVESRNKMDPKHTLVATVTMAEHVGIVRVETQVEAGADKIPQVQLDLLKYSLAPKPGETPSH